MNQTDAALWLIVIAIIISGSLFGVFDKPKTNPLDGGVILRSTDNSFTLAKEFYAFNETTHIRLSKTSCQTI